MIETVAYFTDDNNPRLIAWRINEWCWVNKVGDDPVYYETQEALEQSMLHLAFLCNPTHEMEARELIPFKDGQRVEFMKEIETLRSYTVQKGEIGYFEWRLQNSNRLDDIEHAPVPCVRVPFVGIFSHVKIGDAVYWTISMVKPV